MKILITGVAGTGKSTISKELNKKGIISIDFSDILDLCYWRNATTKDKVKYSPVIDAKWFDSHERICDIEKLKRILDQHENLIFTGSVATKTNQTAYFNLFDKVLLLQCDSKILIQRMQMREPLWGKTEAERNFSIEWQKDYDPLCISNGAIPINNEKTLDNVINKIIAQIQ